MYYPGVSEGYRQFCPLALASETLTQRWMLLILRELCAGATRFSDIHRGVPGIRPSLLKKRLDALAEEPSDGKTIKALFDRENERLGQGACRE